MRWVRPFFCEKGSSWCPERVAAQVLLTSGFWLLAPILEVLEILERLLIYYPPAWVRWRRCFPFDPIGRLAERSWSFRVNLRERVKRAGTILRRALDSKCGIWRVCRRPFGWCSWVLLFRGHKIEAQRSPLGDVCHAGSTRLRTCHSPGWDAPGTRRQRGWTSAANRHG